MNKIVVKDISFSYDKDDYILENVNIEFDNRLTAIVGENGSGKTTFVKLLKGLINPNKGEIIINGKNTKNLTAAKLAKDIGMVFQNPNEQIFKSSVIEEVMFGPMNVYKNKAKAKEMAEKAIEIVGLKDKINNNPYDLNLSDRKLISIASVIAMDTAIIILDEPTIGQDFKGTNKIKDIIFSLKDKGKLVITIIHDMNFVSEVFERVVVFNRGKILLDDSIVKAFTRKDTLKKSGLEVPVITELGKKLGIKDVVLTEDDIVNYYRS